MTSPMTVYHAELDLWRQVAPEDRAMQWAVAHGVGRYMAMTGGSWDDVPPFDPDFHRLRAVAAPTAVLLFDDGDPRSALVPETGLTRYGGAPVPQADTIALSACSGNEVTPVGLAAAEQLRLRLMRAAWADRMDAEREVVANEQRNHLVELLNLPVQPGDAVLLTESGTKAVQAVAHHFAQGEQPCLYLLVGQRETGSEIPAAVAVGPHVAVEGMELRDAASGAAKSAEKIATELENRIAQALDRGMRVVVQVVEGSKTGLVAPGVAGVRSLLTRFPQGVKIVADCCQMRPGTLTTAYWQMGAAVVATGSKFLGGPIFSGIAAIPGGGVPPVPGVGILLRWQAALAESAAYTRLTAQQCAAGLHVFANIFHTECAKFTGLQPILDRYPTHVLTVLLVDKAGQSLKLETLRRLAGWMGRDASGLLPAHATVQQQKIARQRCLIGQPVAVGNRAGLRLGLNAPGLVALVNDRQGVSKLTANMVTTLAKIDLLRSYFAQQQL